MKRIALVIFMALFVLAPMGGSAAPMMRVNGLAMNLVHNAGAESGPASPNGQTPVAVPSWSRVGLLPLINVVRYSYDGFPSLTDPGPSARGKQLFFGGVYPMAAAMQTVNLASFGRAIDTGRIRYAFSAYLGGWAGQADYATATIKFLPGRLTHTLGPVTNLQRRSATGLWLRLAVGYVPKGTRSAQITLRSTRFEGTSNDGYIDNVSLILSR